MVSTGVSKKLLCELIVMSFDHVNPADIPLILASICWRCGSQYQALIITSVLASHIVIGWEYQYQLFG